MPKIIHLIDNNTDGTSIEKDCISDILQIANIGHLQNVPDLLVYPHSFSKSKDGIENLSILTLREEKYKETECVSVKACTGNLMGFVGVNDTSVSIHSRFTHKKQDGKVDEKSQDHFLYYLLQKVFSINIFDLEHASSREDKVLDFLLFLFPLMLKKALSQGLFKEYQTRSYDDAKVKGTICINRFIRNDIPFKGAISYSTHERCYDNSMTQLIRHTIEYIKHHPFGSCILNNDSEMIQYVNQIVQATPTYCQRNRLCVLNANRRPKVHPYYTKYRDLQRLCLHILRHEMLKYGKEKDKVYGILFDGAWLWEEYLDTILKKQGFQHPKNKLKQGGLPMFVNPQNDEIISRNSRRLYPDFYHESNGGIDFILDAKYKHLNYGLGREDLYQVISYMYCCKTAHGGYVFPIETETETSKFQLKGYEGFIHLLPFYVPQFPKDDKTFVEEKEDIKKFVKEIKESEGKIMKAIVNRNKQC